MTLTSGILVKTDFSRIHGGRIRATPRVRKREWMTYMPATWIDQSGNSEDIGSGRCITWCSVAIDLSEEVHTVRETDGLLEISIRKDDYGNP
jgi:sulfhydrogenase subunit beta (sulfur reductase)